MDSDFLGRRLYPEFDPCAHRHKFHFEQNFLRYLVHDILDVGDTDIKGGFPGSMLRRASFAMRDGWAVSCGKTIVRKRGLQTENESEFAKFCDTG